MQNVRFRFRPWLKNDACSSSLINVACAAGSPSCRHKEVNKPDSGVRIEVEIHTGYSNSARSFFPDLTRKIIIAS